MSNNFFSSLIELYGNSPPEKQAVIIKKLSQCGKNEKFINFLDNFIETKNFKADSIFNLLIEYGLEASNSFSPETMKNFVYFFIKYLSKMPNPTNFTKFSEFLITIFANFDLGDNEKMFSTLKNLPPDIGILPLTYFAVRNRSYLQQIFDYATSSPDKLVDNPAAVLWCHSIATLFLNAGKDVHYEVPVIYSCAELAMSYPSIPLSQRFSLLSSSLSFLDEQSSNQLIEAHYRELVSKLASSNTPDELAMALESSLSVYKHLSKQENVDMSGVFDCVFNKILVFYRPCELLDNAITKFCESLDPIVLKALLNPFIAAELNQNASMFIVSHFPDDDFLPYLFGDGTKSIMQFQYNSILYFLTHHTLPSNYIPHIFKIVSVNDMPILDIILEQRPRMYCTAAAKYLATSDDFAKIEYISQAISKKANLPFIRSRSLTTAFMNVAIHTLQGEKAQRSFAVLMEYIFSCSSRNIEEEVQEPNRVQLSPYYNKHDPNRHIEEEEDNNEEEEKTDEEEELQEEENKDDKPKNEEEEEHKEQNNDAEKPKEETNQEEEKPQEKETSDNNNKEEEEKQEVHEEQNQNEEEEQGHKIENQSVNFNVPPTTSQKLTLSRDLSSSTLFQVNDENGLDEGDFFSVADVAFNATSPAMLVHDICLRSTDWCTEITNLTLNEIRNGKSSYCLLIAAVSGDEKLLDQCIAILDQMPSLLVHFFTVCTCVSPTIALKGMTKYITPQVQESSIITFFSQPPVINDVRVETVLHALISMAPFVTVTDDIIELLSFSFKNPGTGDRQRMLFSFEAVRAICSHMKNQLQLDNLIFLMTKQRNNCDPKTFIDALIPALRAAVAIGPKLSNIVSELWISFLVNGVSLDLKCGFEAAFLSHKFRSVTLVPFLTQLERAFIKHEECLPLYMSLARVMRMRSIDPSFLQRYLTLCISNSLSDNLQIRNFCVSTLRATQKLHETIPDISFGDYTMDTVEITRQFYKELASKFNSQTRVLLLDALVKHFATCRSQCKITILMFADCLISDTPDLFIKSTKRFVIQLFILAANSDVSASCLGLISQILYTLQSADPNLFFIQFIEVPETTVSDQFLSRYFGDPKFSKSFSTCVFNKIEEYISGIGDPNKLPKLISYMEKHVINTVFLYSPEEYLSSALFGILIILSQLYIYRKQKKMFPDQYLANIERMMAKFAENTTVSICSPPIDFTSDERYSQAIANMVQNFSRLPNSAVHLFLKKVYHLSNTQHSTTGGIVFSHILAAFSTAYSTSGKQYLAEYLAMFFSFLKDGKTSDPRITTSLMSAISLFTPQSFAVLDYVQITKLLNITLESAITCPMKCLHVLNLITEINDPRIMDMQNGSIISCLRVAVKGGCDEKIAMEVLLKTVKARHEAEWFIKETPICFSTLSSKVIKEKNETVEQILMTLLDIPGEEFNAKAVFSTMMSLFAAFEQNYGQYIKIADNAIRSVDPTRATEHQISTISAIVIPLTSIAESLASPTLDNFTKFLNAAMKKNPDNESLSAALEAFEELSDKRIILPQKN